MTWDKPLTSLASSDFWGLFQLLGKSPQFYLTLYSLLFCVDPPRNLHLAKVLSEASENTSWQCTFVYRLPSTSCTSFVPTTNLNNLTQNGQKEPAHLTHPMVCCTLDMVQLSHPGSCSEKAPSRPLFPLSPRLMLP